MLPKRPTYNLENLLTPIVEFYSVAICLLFAFILWYLPGLIMMTPPIAYSASAILVVFALIRFSQGYQVLKYQRGLKKLPTYTLSDDKIPVSNKKLFLGKGFRWRAIHTQRLRNIHNSDDPDKWLSPNWLYQLARRLELTFEFTPILRKVVLIFSADSFFNPVRPLPPVGGAPEIHAVGMYEGEHNILMDLGERVGHTLVLGTTRVGKTRLAEILITQDIRRGDCVFVFDPKGDADLMKRVYTEAKKADRPVYIFHLGYPDISARYNPVGDFSRITEVASRIADQLPSEGNSAAFKMFAWRFVNIIAQALVKLGDKPDYTSVRRYIFSMDRLFVRYAHFFLNEEKVENWATSVQVIQDNIDERSLGFNLKGRDEHAIALLRFIENNEDIYDSVLEGLMGAFRFDKSFYDKIVSSLGPLLDQLTSGRSSELLAPEYYDTNDHRPVFDWTSAIQQNAVVYVGLDALSDAVVGSAIGASMFSDLTSVAGSLYKFGLDHGQATIRDKKGNIIKTKLPKISLHADEFNEIVGDQFIPMLNKAGGAGFQVTAYTQTAADILAGIGSEAKAGQIEGNFNTTIMLRVKNPSTAEVFTSQLAEVEVASTTSVSRATDSSEVGGKTTFGSSTEDRLVEKDVDILTTSHFTQLPKGQAFVLKEGGQLYKVRLPLPQNNDDLPDGLKMIADDMKQRYCTETNADWFSSQDIGWYRDPVNESLMSSSETEENTQTVTGNTTSQADIINIQEVANG